MFVFVYSDLYKICFGYFFIILNESYIFMFYNYLLLKVADTCHFGYREENKNQDKTWTIIQDIVSTII